MTKKQQSRARPSGQLRIIAGQWRGRKLTVPTIEGLRPTTDRIRETVFNWLNPVINGAHCLDLFAGSGALALEALSRGAQHVDLVETNPSAVKQLRKHLLLLKADNASIWQQQAQSWLQQYAHSQHKPYDIVFIDPPFRTHLANECINILNEKNVLAPEAWIYLETGRDEALPELPPHWNIHREKTAGQVCYRLITTQ